MSATSHSLFNIQETLKPLGALIGLELTQNVQESIQKCASNSAKFLTLGSPDAYMVLMAMASQFPTPEIVSNVIQPLLDSTTISNSIRVSLLLQFYGLLPVDSKCRFILYQAYLKASSDDLEGVLSSLDSLENSVSQWGITLDETRSLYLTISQMMTDPNVSFEWLVKVLKTYQETPSEAGSTSVKKLSAEAIKRAIALPLIYNFEELSSLKALVVLAPSKWLELLDIFAHSNVETYTAFITQNPTFLNDNGLDPGATLAKMRVLTLASFANTVSGPIDLARVCEALNIQSEEAEYWVIDAMRAGLIDAKMDQLKSTVHITYLQVTIEDRPDGPLEVKNGRRS